MTRRQRSVRTVVVANNAPKGKETMEGLARQIEKEEYGSRRDGGDRGEAAKMTGREDMTRGAGGDVEGGIEHVFKWHLGGTHVAVYGDFNGW